ncbi:MAG: hypothetical protein HQ581_07690 [Planctomycetes bacterium]|nr:hypothetical protein [Planctomycetota bacterium]
MAAAHRLPLTPHAGCHLMEYIPWLRDCFEEPVTVEGGDYKTPQNPGAGTTFKADVLERFAAK